MGIIRQGPEFFARDSKYSRMRNLLVVNFTKKNYSLMSEFCNLHCVIKAYCHQKVKNNLNVNL
jgi:hypothetical protein